jgi:hypothetical protein
MSIPDFGFLREKQIVGDPKANPPIPAIIPISQSAWRSGVRAGLYPAPVKIGKKAIAWRIADIRRLIATGVEG